MRKNWRIKMGKGNKKHHFRSGNEATNWRPHAWLCYNSTQLWVAPSLSLLLKRKAPPKLPIGKLAFPVACVASDAG
jgi:hypothetical protein